LRWRIAYALHEPPDVLRAYVDEGLAAAGGTASEVEVRLRVLDARTEGTYAGDRDAFLRKAEYALGLAKEQGVAEGFAHSVLGSALTHRSEAGWEEHLTTAVELCRRDGDVLHEFTATNTLVYARFLSGSVERALAAADDGAAHARRLRLRAWERRFIAWSVALHWALGNPRVAAAHADAMLSERLPPGDLDVLEPYACQALIDLGSIEEARAVADQLQGRAVPDPDSLGEALWARADLELWSGRPREALAAADEYRERFASMNVSETARFVELTAAWARYELRLEQRPAVFAQRHPLTAASDAEVHGIAALADENWQLAASRFADAAQSWSGRNARHELRSLWAQGDAARRSGARAEAQSLLEAVEQRARNAGFRLLLARVHRSLRLAGLRRSATRSLSGTLTKREREVLALVAQGLSNSDIARRLGLSRATVAEHVASGADKLGARSRAQAAALSLQP
jgi:DNA-binding CsgD family transcriptional regulator